MYFKKYHIDRTVEAFEMLHSWGEHCNYAAQLHSWDFFWTTAAVYQDHIIYILFFATSALNTQWYVISRADFQPSEDGSERVTTEDLKEMRSISR